MMKPIRYVNRRFRFSILFPRRWRNHIVVSCPVMSKGEVYIRFIFRYGGILYEPIFTIIISPFGRKEWRRRYTDSPLEWLGTFRGKSYSYLLPEELPDAFLKPDHSDYDYKKHGKPIRLLIRMVGLVPAVLKTIKFIK
jgi:hypothetical protein